MASESSNYNKLLLILIALGIFICAFFLFDNYRDKQRVKNAIEEKREIDAANNAAAEIQIKAEEKETIKKNIDILKSGKICKGSIKPKVHQWVFNNITEEALLIMDFSEWYPLGDNAKGVCTINAVNENLGTVYTRYANQLEVDKMISSVEMMSK